jgi:predicted metalloprotease with PDZ domain
VRLAPNARIVADFWKDPAVSDLAYQRGYLLAFRWDDEIRRATRGKANLDQVMFAMRDRYGRASSTAKPAAVANLEASAKAVAGVNLGPDIETFAVRGEAIDLPPGLFGPCARISTVTFPAFDLGFDAGASAAKGVFVGVDPSGPAFRSGLRDGMKRVSRAGGEPGDSRVEIAYRVIDQRGAERQIRYRPEGRTAVTFREATFTTAAMEQGSSCARRLGGAG